MQSNEEKIPRLGSDEYNDEPVFFCRHCLSLAVRDIGFGDYCCNCGSTDILKRPLDVYDKIHYAKYKKKVFFK